MHFYLISFVCILKFSFSIEIEAKTRKMKESTVLLLLLQFQIGISLDLYAAPSYNYPPPPSFVSSYMFKANADIINCTYINSQVDSVELDCNGPISSFMAFDSYESAERAFPWSKNLRDIPNRDSMENITSGCYYDLFKSDLKDKNRHNVKLLKPMNSCEYNNSLSELFDNIRELEFNTHSFHRVVTRHQNFKNLKFLNASHNSLTTLDLTSFNNNPNLNEIDFSNNNIEFILGAIIDKNTKLSVINLSHNDLKMMANPEPAVGIGSVKKLKILDLSFNKIFYIAANTFKNNNNLETLRLDNNPLTIFDCLLFSPIKSLRKLTVNLDRIEKLALNCAEFSINSVSNNKSEIEISLSGVENGFRYSKDYFKKLNYFSMGKNDIKNISEIIELLPSSLELLIISSNNLKTSSVNILNKFIDLKYLSQFKTVKFDRFRAKYVFSVERIRAARPFK